MTRLHNKTALITGGTSGIGLATARAFLAQGARVAITGQNPERLAASAAALGAGVVPILADQSVAADMARAATTLKQVFGGLDILFVNAGVAKPATLEQITEAHIREHFDVNFNGVIFTIQNMVPLLRNPASIVLTSSVSTEQGLAGLGVYSASKAAVRLLARTLSAELLLRGIRVNTVNPGPIQTPLFGKMGIPPEMLEEMAGQLIAKVPMGRLGQAEEVAQAVVFLASDESSYIAGQDLFVDGGMAAI